MASELLIPPGFAQLSIPMRHTGLSRAAVVTFGIEYSEADTPYANILDWVLQQWGETLGATVDSEVTQGPIEGRFGVTGGEPIGIVGTDTFTSISVDARPPAQVALLIKKSTNRGGRRGRGRMFLPWAVNETSVSELGVVEAGTLSDFQDAADAFLLAIGTASGEDGPNPMFLLHVQSDEQSTTPGVPNVVSALEVQALVATQRRRLAR